MERIDKKETERKGLILYCFLFLRGGGLGKMISMYYIHTPAMILYVKEVVALQNIYFNIFASENEVYTIY